MESDAARGEKSPGRKLTSAILIALALAIPLFSIFMLVYDRQSQSETARNSIAEGWGGPQTLAGPLLVIPYLDQAVETVTEAGKPVTRTTNVWRELTLAPEAEAVDTAIRPERRKRSIYEAVIYEAAVNGSARFALPQDIARFGVRLDQIAFDRAELRFGLSDARGLFGPPPRVSIGGKSLVLQPGKGPGATGGSGFFAWLDASALKNGTIGTRFAFDFRGNGWLALSPQAGDTRWAVRSSWQHPSFQGGFLPVTRRLNEQGFSATYRLGNLSLGRALMSAGPPQAVERPEGGERGWLGKPAGDSEARVTLVQPADLYAQVNRAVKYGFLFIGFTFLAFLMFDVIGGVCVSGVEYLLVGAGLILFFAMLLALAEVIGFTTAYMLASAAIIGEIAAYSAAVLGSWRRAGLIGGLLVALYAVLYILLSLEAYSLLIGSLLLFATLGTVMFVTRRVDWSGRRSRVLTA